MTRIIFVFSFWGVQMCGFAQSIDSLMEQYFKVLGGKEKVASIQSSKETSSNWIVQGGSGPIKALTYIKLPCFRAFIEYNKQEKTGNMVLYNSAETITVYGDFIERENKITEDVKLCEATDLLNLLNSKRLVYVGAKTIDGNVYYVAKTVRTKYTDYYYFNPVTGLLDAHQHGKIEGKLEYFKDYRSTNLILQPYVLETYIEGKLVYQQLTETFEFNPEISDSLFYYK